MSNCVFKNISIRHELRFRFYVSIHSLIKCDSAVLYLTGTIAMVIVITVKKSSGITATDFENLTVKLRIKHAQQVV